jgi:hypothetical protein
LEITDTTPVADTKWPRWAWFVYPALAIAIGGGLGAVVGFARQETEPRRQTHATVKPIVAAPQPSVAPAAPSPEIEIQPIEVPPFEVEADPVKAATGGSAPRATAKPKVKAKPTKSTPCNVYDHMNGC